MKGRGSYLVRNRSRASSTICALKNGPILMFAKANISIGANTDIISSVFRAGGVASLVRKGVMVGV